MADLFKSCTACGWTALQQERCSCLSHIKLFYGAGNRGTWSIGSDVILKERHDEGPKNEVTTLRYLANYPAIPAPKVLHDWIDSNERYFALQERIHGQTLEEAWPFMSNAQKVAIADQMVEVRSQLRSLTSPSIQCVDQIPSYYGLLFSDSKPHVPFHSNDELWDAICRSLQDSLKTPLPRPVLENLKKRIPPCEPCVLTHCDLNLGNIVVKDGSLAGVLDWEFAAFYPIWHEYVSASWGWTEDDAEWKKLLQERLELHDDGYPDAKSFWKDLRCLRKYPDLDEKGREVLESLS